MSVLSSIALAILGIIGVVQAWLMVAATAVIVFNILADVLYAALDPRIRLA